MGKRNSFKKKIVGKTTWLIILAIVLSLFNGVLQPIKTSAASVKLIASVVSSPKQVAVGDRVELVVNVSASIAVVPGPLHVVYTNQSGGYFWTDLIKGSDGSFRGSIVIDQTAKNGLYQISGIDIMEGNGGQYEVYNSVLYPTQAETEDLSGGDFSVTNPNEDITPPVVTSISVDHRTVYLGESVEITAHASDVGLGIDGNILLNYRSSVQTGQQVTLEPVGDGTFVGTLVTKPGEKIGTWYIGSMTLKDLAGNHVTIENSTREPNSTFTKMNLDQCDLTVYLATGRDDESPIIDSLTIDRNQITGGQKITLMLKVSDQSGIEPLITGTYEAPDYATNLYHDYKQFKFSKPVAGVYKAEISLGSQIGNWILSGFTITDLAGNETILNNKKLSADGKGDDLTKYEVTVGCNVVFDTLGGSAVDMQFTSNGYVREPEPPTKSGLYFSGWYVNESYVNRWDFSKDKVTTSTKLFAKWVDTPDKVVIPEFPYFAKTTATSLNMRIGPSTWYQTKTTIPKGTIIKVEFKDNNWFKIDHQGIKGYVSTTYIQKSNQDLIYSINKSVNFRTGPTTAYPIITKLILGTYVELVDKTTATWWKISVNGTVGYVSASYLSKTAPNPPPIITPEPTPDPLQTWYMVNSAVNFRIGPSTTSMIIKKVTVGTTLQLISKIDANWWKVSINGQTGYLSGKYVESVVYPLRKYINLEPLNLRTGPSSASSVITKLPQSTMFTLVQKTTPTWWKVYVNDKIGYVSAKYLNFMPGVE